MLSASQTSGLAPLHPSLGFDKFKPALEHVFFFFKCISCWLTGSFFGPKDRGFLKEEVKTYLKAPMSTLNSPTIFSVCTYIVYMNPRLH
jgi:hypothetical protein